jgi:hypothetical protein
VVLAVVLVIDWVPDWLADAKKLATDTEKVEEVGRTRTALLAFLAGVIATAGAIVTGLGYRLSRSGQITDRFTKAMEQLTKEADSPLPRLGGIYALERIAHDSKRDDPRIMEVLTAYVRTKAPVSDEEPPVQLTDDIQAALAVIKRRNESFDQHALDLRSTALRGALLPGADLRGAILTGADLRRADLCNAQLGKRQFADDKAEHHADLRGAIFTGPDLRAAEEHARLDRADIAFADFEGATISREIVSRARNVDLATNLNYIDDQEARPRRG